MYVHGPYVSRIFISPYDIQKVLSAVYFVGIENQKFKQIELFGGKIDLFSRDKYSPALTVQFQIAGFDCFRLFLLFIVVPRPAHDRLDPGLYFQNIEGLGNIIVRAVFQAQDLIHIFALGSKHHDRNIGKLPDLLTDFKTVHLGKHKIQENDIIMVLPGLLHCLFSVIGTVHFHTVLLQIETDPFYNQFLVIHY